MGETMQDRVQNILRDAPVLNDILKGRGAFSSLCDGVFICKKILFFEGFSQLYSQLTQALTPHHATLQFSVLPSDVKDKGSWFSAGGGNWLSKAIPKDATGHYLSRGLYPVSGP